MKLANVETRLAEVVSERDEFQAAVKSLQGRLMNAQDPADICDLLGLAPFLVDGFSPALAAVIREIAVNPTLKSPAKLRQRSVGTAE
jgi:hypothetical protein